MLAADEEGVPVKLLSRVASPAGFGLVLVLFFLLPFLSVSCDVPGVGKAGVDYTGTHLVTDDTPDWQSPEELTELLGTPREATDEQAPAGVQVLAIVLVVLAAAGVAVGLLPRLTARLYGSAALAGATLAVAVVTVVVALGNLRTLLVPQANEIATDEAGLDPDSLVDEALHTEVGFWLVAGLSAVLVLGNLGAVFLSRKATQA
jgi:hypothetical protein